MGQERRPKSQDARAGARTHVVPGQNAFLGCQRDVSKRNVETLQRCGKFSGRDKSHYETYHSKYLESFYNRGG